MVLQLRRLSGLHKDGCMHPRTRPSSKPRAWSLIHSTPPWPQPDPGQSGCFCCGLSFLLLLFAKVSNKPKSTSGLPPSAPLGHNHSTQTRWVEGGVSEWFRIFLQEMVREGGAIMPLQFRDQPVCPQAVFHQRSTQPTKQMQNHKLIGACWAQFTGLFFPWAGTHSDVTPHSPLQPHFSSNLTCRQ